MASRFYNIIVIFIERKNKRMEDIYYQINYCQSKENSYRTQQDFAFEVVPVQISNNKAYPGEHSQEHKKEI